MNSPTGAQAKKHLHTPPERVVLAFTWERKSKFETPADTRVSAEAHGETLSCSDHSTIQPR